MSMAFSPVPSARDIDCGVGVLLRNADGRFAAIKRSDTGKVQLPAGFLQEGENPGEASADDSPQASPDEHQAAARELEEETGIRVDPKDLVPIHVTSTSRARRYVFFALPPGKPYRQGTPLTPDEGEPVWSDADTLRRTHRTNPAAFDAWDRLFPVAT